MSAGYRDELDAALAAKESLQAQNNELQAQLNQTQNALGQAQNTIAQQQAMLQQYGIQAPASHGAKPGAAIAVIVAVALMVLMAGAGAAFFVFARPSAESTPPSTVRVESVPAVPAQVQPVQQSIVDPPALQPSSPVATIAPNTAPNN